MTTLDRPSFAILGCVKLSPRRLRCSVFRCEPRYRILRAVIAPKHITTFAHAGLRSLLKAGWLSVRAHSSWSRA